MKRIGLGVILVLLLFVNIGTVTAQNRNANYYDLGRISGSNYALIKVSPIENNNSDLTFINLVKIDGQGDTETWRRPRAIVGSPQVYVRVPPGEHTFTITITRSITDATNNRTRTTEIPMDITYDVKAGKGYTFIFQARYGGGFSVHDVTAEIMVLESNIVNDAVESLGLLRQVDSQGNLTGIPNKFTLVERRRETFLTTSSDLEGFNTFR